MDQDKLNSISSLTSKLLRKNFGKGPKSCQSTICKQHLVIYVQGFISPMEEVLIQQGQQKQVEKARAVIIEHVLEELKGIIKVSLDREVEESYHDWNFPNNSGLIFFVLNEEIDQSCDDNGIYLKKLENEIARISELVQKVPNSIRVFPLSQSIYLVEREGILIPIEKALIAKGFAEELRITKDELEKSYFHRYGNFDEIFKNSIKDIFIDWNFKKDKSLMAFVFNT
ncbi:Na-translocating system protein MpsC family protein [Metabacillus litoralis]|uniref:Na-translocating system protein MpsC family protein n=1 Tax=Metabacillus litoralis TaxID=152268 RepID=UPI001CFE36C5|nr:Na-translocating system protein MpsC family protein [Metabacillus litoralis]